MRSLFREAHLQPVPQVRAAAFPGPIVEHPSLAHSQVLTMFNVDIGEFGYVFVPRNGSANGE